MQDPRKPTDMFLIPYRRLYQNGEHEKFILIISGEGYELQISLWDFHINRTDCCKSSPVPYEYPMFPHGSVGRP
jgi:hypothetical protein